MIKHRNKILAWLIAGLSFSFTADEKLNYNSPLDIPLALTGSFGELRSNHFHSGLDIKTEGREGLNVYSIADGYVSRIKVSSGGYGLAIYINHPSTGQTSVYGHLSKYNARLQSYVYEQQYKAKNFEIDLFPKANELAVKKGEIIALSGNTGGSGGPHLHFEIRDTKTEYALNPLNFGFKVSDHKAPVISGLYIYPYTSYTADENANPVYYTALNADGKYTLKEKTIAVPNEFYIGVDVHDKQDLYPNQNGIFSLLVLADTDTVYQFIANEFSFDWMRYANSTMDYEIKNKLGKYVYKAIIEPGNAAKCYLKTENDQCIKLKLGEKNMRIVAKDWAGNTSELSFKVKPTEAQNTIQAPNGKYVSAVKDTKIDTTKLTVSIKSGTIYRDTYLELGISEGSANALSNKVKFGSPYIPVHKNFTVEIEGKNYSKYKDEQILLACVGLKNRLNVYATNRRGDNFTASPKEFGTFYLVTDTIAPNVKPNNFKDGLAWPNAKLSLHISDNLSGIKSYNAYLNEKWVLAELDGKTGTIKIVPLIEPNAGEHTLRIDLVDLSGNKTSKTFTLKKQ